MPHCTISNETPRTRHPDAVRVRNWLTEIVLAMLVFGTTTSLEAQQSIDSLTWLAGHWVNDAGSTVQEEYWMPPSGGIMPGLHRDVASNGKAFFEYLRIVETDGLLVYHASPGGKAETLFRADSLSERFVRFVNAGHDYPQKIQYELTDTGRLVAIISDAQGENVRRWEFNKKQ